MEIRKAQNLMDALGYTAGVGRLEGADKTGDSFVIRGFKTFTTYRDGSKYQVNSYDGQQEPYGLERIEVLKGAASVLYGSVAPGGLINTVSKRPTIDPLHELNVELGSFSRKQLSGDFGGALTDNGEWSYRLTFLQRDSDTFVDYVPDNRTYIAPAIKWQPSQSTSLTLLAEYQHDRTAYLYGLPAEGTVLDNVNGRIPRSRFVGEPDYDKYDNKRYSTGYLLEHQMNDQLQLKHSLRYYKSDSDNPSIWISGLAPDRRTTLYRGALDRQDHSNAVTSDTSLQYKWNAGKVAHTTLAGFDYAYSRFSTKRYNRTASSLDLYDPVYGSGLGDPVPTAAASSWKNRTRQAGLYVQDQMKFDDKWVGLLGGRQDWVRYDDGTAFAPGWNIKNEKTKAFTGRAGLVYLADNGLAPYVSFSQSFEPTSGRDRIGSRFQPTEGEQYELGVRYQPEGSDLMLSAALYQLTQQNVLVTDPVDTSYSTQLGKVRSRGVELEAKTRLGRYTRLTAAYAYTDARTLKSSPLTPALEGKRSGGVPYNQFSLWADYDFGGAGIPGLKAGAGVRYVGATDTLYLTGKIPAFTLFDAMVSYDTGPWRIALNVTNLADKTYIASGTYGYFYGEPRKVILTTTYRW